MKAPFLAAVALVAVTFAGVAQAGPGPISPLYLTYVNGGSNIVVVQGNSVINTFPQAYGGLGIERPIAVWGDVRTTGYTSGTIGGQYTLGGTPTGTSYVLGAGIRRADDATSDGFHNYVLDYRGGTVYQTARDFSNPTALFNPAGFGYSGITYDAANNSLWISGLLNSTVVDYSLNGTLLSSFSTGHSGNLALALDPADHTLWLVGNAGNLEQYSTAGVLLSTGPYVGGAFGGEFNLEPTTTPEPETLIKFGSGILGLAGVLRRKINL